MTKLPKSSIAPSKRLEASTSMQPKRSRIDQNIELKRIFEAREFEPPAPVLAQPQFPKTRAPATPMSADATSNGRQRLGVVKLAMSQRVLQNHANAGYELGFATELQRRGDLSAEEA